MTDRNDRRCPACDSDFEVPYSPPVDGVWRTPSLRLELAGNKEGDLRWRLSLFDDPLGRTWPCPDFRANDVNAVYHMCGDGHLFLRGIRMPGVRTSDWQAHHTDVLATVGGVAAGKSNLMLRTLRQLLTVGGLEARADATVEHYEAHWLEEVPMTYLVRAYNQMLDEGLPIGPTTIQSMLPVEILADRVGNGVLAGVFRAYTEICQDPSLVNADEWGQRVRQPIIRRFEIGGHRVMLGVADMPGEQFVGDRGVADHESAQRLGALSNYGSLVWVIDPVVCSGFAPFLPAEDPDASMRPERNLEIARARRGRRGVQAALAESLSAAGSRILANINTQVRLNFCVSKADLIHGALRAGGRLTDIGARGAVVEGATEYLLSVAKRAGERGLTGSPDIHRDVIEPLTAVRHQKARLRDLTVQLADALIGHYSDPEAFWALVHEGAGHRVEVPEGRFNTLPARTIEVPSLDAHIVTALVPGQSGVLHARDLVMSTVACGVAFGLGYRDTMLRLFNTSVDWRDTRFYLCSPLVHVPAKPAGTSDRITPAGGAEFPDIHERSAALSQLLLSLLRGVRS